MPELDTSVFNVEFDPHGRARQCKRLIQLIQTNKPETQLEIKRFNKNKLKIKALTSENRESLLDYAQFMISRIKQKEIGVHSFEKNLSEAWALCLFMVEKSVSRCTKEDVEKWWNYLIERYQNNEIKRDTLVKLRTCALSFFQFLESLPATKAPSRIEGIRIPKKPKETLEEVMPTQLQVKQLIEAVYEEGKRYTIRDQTILKVLRNGPLMVTELSKKLGNHRSSVSQQLLKMEKAGFVQCLTPNRVNYRIYGITKKGLDILDG